MKTPNGFSSDGLPFWLDPQRHDQTTSGASPISSSPAARPAARPADAQTGPIRRVSSRTLSDAPPARPMPAQRYLAGRFAESDPDGFRETRRQEQLHDGLLWLLQGNWRADISRPHGSPRMIADIGCGAGTWLATMALQFPHAAGLLGVDRHLPTPLQLARRNMHRVHFMAADVTVTPLPTIASDSFHFAHIRDLGRELSLDEWPVVVAEATRIVMPGGWVEVVELLPHELSLPEEYRNLNDEERQRETARRGPALLQLTRWRWELAQRTNSNPGMAADMDALMRQVGLVNVALDLMTMPMGPQFGKGGALFEDIYLGSLATLDAQFEAHDITDRQTLSVVLQHARVDLSALYVQLPVVVCRGQKALRPR